MMNFTIDREPQAQARHRHKKVGNFIMTYDPNSQDKKSVQVDIVRQMNEKGFKRLGKVPIELEVINYTKIPKSLSRKARIALDGKPCITKPDIDNYCKFVLDLMNGIAYEDDSCVTTLRAEKIYSFKPRVELKLRSFETIVAKNEEK